MTSVLDSQVRFYGRVTRRATIGRPDPREVETLIDVGLALLQATEAAALRDAEAPGADLPELGRRYDPIYRALDRQLDHLAEAARAAQADGKAVTGAERLRDARGYLKAALSVSPERLAAAEADFRAGRGRPLGEVMDELRRRHRA